MASSGDAGFLPVGAMVFLGAAASAGSLVAAVVVICFLTLGSAEMMGAFLLTAREASRILLGLTTPLTVTMVGALTILILLMMVTDGGGMSAATCTEMNSGA